MTRVQPPLYANHADADYVGVLNYQQALLLYIIPGMRGRAYQLT